MMWSTDADDVKMLLDIPFPMNHVIIDQLALTLVDIFLNNKLQTLCKSLLCFEKIEKIDWSKNWLVKFRILYFKTAYLAQLLTDFINLDVKIKLGVCFIQNKRNFEN